MLNLMLHCGSQHVERTSPVLTAIPEPMGPQHHPIPYMELIQNVERELGAYGLVIQQERFGALKDGARFFGLLEVVNGHKADDYATVIGLRASHDQSIAAGIVAGSGVFVCDNLCFSGEVKIGTKQTTNILDRLPYLVHDAISSVGRLVDMQHERFGKYKETEIPKRVGDAAITELVRRGAVNPSQVGRVIEQWDTPKHEEHAQFGNSVWKLQSAVTEVYKPAEGQNTNMGVLPERSQTLTQFCDELAGIEW